MIAQFDWRILILPVGFILLCIVYYGGIWFYRMRLRGRRMKQVATAIGGTYTAGFDAAATRAIPQFEGTPMRLARAAYNTVSTEWTLQGRSCRVWMGDAGNQFNSDALVQVVGGEIVAGFIAIESPIAHVRDAVVIHKEARVSQQRGRLRWHRAGGAVINLVEFLQDYVSRRGLTRFRTGMESVDRALAIYVDSTLTLNSIFSRDSMECLAPPPPFHIWIKDGIILLEAGDMVWSATDFISAARWVQGFMGSWDPTAAPSLALSPES